MPTTPYFMVMKNVGEPLHTMTEPLQLAETLRDAKKSCIETLSKHSTIALSMLEEEITIRRSVNEEHDIENIEQ